MALPLLLVALLSGQDAVPAGAPLPDLTAVVSQAEYTPQGAPKDDYAFTGWCRGVLEGHMALAERVQPVLALDEVQQRVGNVYLAGYDQALEIGGRTRSKDERDEAARARRAARANWDTAMKADLQLAADTYLAWQLPGRCEHAAKRVAGKDDLFKMEAPADGELIGAGAAAAETIPTSLGEAPAALDTGAEVELADLPYVDLAPGVAAPEEAAPVEVEAAAAPEATAEATPAEAKPGEPRTGGMPAKGRLLPFGKRK